MRFIGLLFVWTALRELQYVIDCKKPYCMDAESVVEVYYYKLSLGKK